MRDDSAPSRSEHRLHRLIFEHSSDPTVVVDDDGRVVTANRAARELPGVDVEQLFVWSADRDPELTSLRAQLRVGGRGAVEVKLPDGRGGRRVFALEGRAHAADYVIVLRDVTARRLLEDEVAQLRRLQDTGELAAGAAHDFNNLLTAILFGSSLLAGEVADRAHAAELARDIHDGAERAVTIVRRMLSFLRRPRSSPERTHPGVAVAEARAVLELAAGPDVEVALQLDPRAGDVVVERDELDRTLLALAASARDAMPAGGKLTIAVAPVPAAKESGGPGGDYVAITVTDSGPGMAPEARERAFEHMARSSPAEGTLALATAHRFAKRSGGCVAVRSAPGRGTTVAVYLPSVGPVGRPARSGESPEDVPGGSETILLVEPDEPVRGALGAVLQELGYRVLTAASGEAALHMAARSDADVRLVLADLRAPGLLGDGVIDRLRDGHAARFLWMSGEPDRVIADRAVDGPLLRKAFSPAQLARRVREVLDE